MISESTNSLSHILSLSHSLTTSARNSSLGKARPPASRGQGCHAGALPLGPGKSAVRARTARHTKRTHAIHPTRRSSPRGRRIKLELCPVLLHGGVLVCPSSPTPPQNCRANQSPCGQAARITPSSEISRNSGEGDSGAFPWALIKIPR